MGMVARLKDDELRKLIDNMSSIEDVNVKQIMETL